MMIRPARVRSRRYRAPAMTDAALPDRPRVLEGGVLATIAGAVVGGVQAVGLLLRLGTARQQVEQQAPGSADAVAALLAGIAIAGVVYAVVLVALALLLRAGRTRARTALLVVSPLSLLGAIALTTPGIVSAILVGLAVSMLFRPDATAWVAEVRRRRAGGRP